MAFELSSKQNEYILSANARWNFKVGAVRSGKSYVDTAYVIPSRLRAVAGETGLSVILGVSRETIERNVLEPMREIYTSALVSHINNKNLARVCGEWVYCLGAEKISQVAKIQGSSIKYCYGDEVAKWSKEVFEMLKSRLDKPYSCFDGSLNPEGPNHWLKKFLDTAGLNKYIQPYVIDDNPFLPPDYVENLKKEYAGTVYYDRYILGRWALAEGLIYPMYNRAIVSGLPPGETLEYCVSIDYGTMNAFAMLLWERRQDGVWYATRKYYYSGRATGVQKTDVEYLRDIEAVLFDLVEAVRGQQSPDGLGLDGNENESYAGLEWRDEPGPLVKIPVIIDPSAASFIALLKKSGWAKVRAADNSVLDGIRETAAAMYQGKIKVLDHIVEFRKEAEGYVWDEKAGEDKPIKENDHCLAWDTMVEIGGDPAGGSVAVPIRSLVGTEGKVWSYDPLTGGYSLQRYRDCRMTREAADVVKVTLGNGRSFRCTPDHLVYTCKGYVPAGLLDYADKLPCKDGGFVWVESVERAGVEAVYNLEVETNHNFLVEGGVVVHNCMDAVRYFVKTKRIAKKPLPGGSGDKVESNFNKGLDKMGNLVQSDGGGEVVESLANYYPDSGKIKRAYRTGDFGRVGGSMFY